MTPAGLNKPCNCSCRSPDATVCNGLSRSIPFSRSSPIPRRPRYSGHKRDLSDPSPALDGCNGLRTRSLNDPRRGSLPTVRTVIPLSTSPRHLQAKPMHPSPSAREFRLLLNGLPASAPRRMLLTLRICGVRRMSRGLPCLRFLGLQFLDSTGGKRPLLLSRNSSGLCTRYGQRPCGPYRDFHRQNVVKPARCHRRWSSAERPASHRSAVSRRVH